MINLLANGRKDRIKAARSNIVILRYMAIILLATSFICATLFVSHSILSSTMANAESIIESNDLKASVYSDTKQQVEALSLRLEGARGILDQEVRYSQVLIRIGQLTPPGTILDSLALNNSSFSGQPVEVKIFAKSPTEASLVQSQFQNSSLFSQATIQSTETTGGINGYPVVMTMSLTFNRAGI